MTFAEVEFACEGYEKREARRKEVERITAGILANVHRGKNTPAMSFAEVYPLITDVKKEKQTKEDYEKTLNLFGRKAPTPEDKEKLLKRLKWQRKDLKRN